MTGITASPVIGGSVDNTHDFVVALRLPQGATCSGVLISPKIVLTAGHCTWGRSASEIEVLLGSDSGAPKSTLTVTKVALYPGATGTTDDFIGGVDLAALELETEANTAPAVLATEPDLFEGQTITLIGFGRTLASDPTSAQTRQSVDLPISRVCRTTLESGDATSNSCEGDSGGAVLLGASLVGIISAGHSGCDLSAVQTRLDTRSAWVDAILVSGVDASCPNCPPGDEVCGSWPTTGAGGSGGTGAQSSADSGDSGGCAVRNFGAASPEVPGCVWLWFTTAVLGIGVRQRHRWARQNKYFQGRRRGDHG